MARTFFGALYGVLFVLLIYLVSFWSTRGVLKGSHISWVVVMGKYLVYVGAIRFGLNIFPMMPMLFGFTVGLYLSLPILYWVNKKYSFEEGESS